MPFDYKKYPANWRTELRPAVLERSKNADGKPCCEKCRVPNYKVILRGVWGGIEVYQDDDGRVFDEAFNGLDQDGIFEIHQMLKDRAVNKQIIIVTHGDKMDIMHSGIYNLEKINNQTILS